VKGGTVNRLQARANGQQRAGVCQRKATEEDRQRHPPHLATWHTRCFACRKAGSHMTLLRPSAFAIECFVADGMRWARGATLPLARPETLPPGDELVPLCPAPLRKSRAKLATGTPKPL